MESFFGFLIEMIGAVLEIALEGVVSSFWDVLSLEWIGFLGASAVLIFSLGRIQWENKDWRAISVGMLLMGTGVVLTARWIYQPPVPA